MTARSVSLTIALCIFCVGCASSRHELWSCDECRFHDVVTAAANAAMDSGAEIANVTESTDPHCVKLLLVWGMKNLTPESPILRVEISAENSQVCVRVSDDIVANYVRARGPVHTTTDESDPGSDCPSCRQDQPIQASGVAVDSSLALANTRRARESFHQAFERRIQGSAQPGSDAQRDSGGALESQPPSGNVEYAPAEMKKNGVEVVHLATGLLVGYPPCPHIEGFCGFIEAEYGIEVVLGAHPVPQNYFETHEVLGTSNGPGWQSRLEGTLTDERTRRSYGRNSQRGKQP